MPDCPACGASLAHKGNLHCTSGSCPWVICGSCNSTVDADTETYWNGQHLTWGDVNGYIKGGESVCQPQNTPKPNATKHSPSTKPTDPQPSKNNSTSPKAP